MRENAEQGFCNGTTPPLGYRSVTAETRGAKLKKRLEIDPVEAEVVRLAFDLYLNEQAGGRWPLGIKKVVKILNEGGHRTRGGALFGVGPMHHILTARHYATGLYPYGATNADTGEANPPETVVHIPIPPIVEAKVFDAVQAMLALKNPRVTAPRAGNGPSLLIGLATCAVCGAGMTRTGTTRRGRRYSYYTCAGRHQKGETACLGQHIPTAKLDDAVLSALKDRLLQPERLEALIESIVQRRLLRDQDVARRIAGLQAVAIEAGDKLKRLYALVENGAIAIDEILSQRIHVLQADKAKADAALERAAGTSTSPGGIAADQIERFGQIMRARLNHGDVNAKRAYIASVVSTIEVGSATIRIIGRRDTLENRIRTEAGKVRGFVRRWRTRHDSNVWPPPSEGGALSS